MILQHIKTALLLVGLSSILLCLGYLFGGTTGLQAALIMSLMVNALTYFFSETIVLRMYGAQPLDTTQYAWIYDMVGNLAYTMRIPVPKLWIVKTPMANAFATGRNPANASVALTTGILDILQPHELRGVLAHELAHIKNRDILVSTIAATLATAISYLGHWLQHAAIWSSAQEKRRSGNTLGMILLAIFMPLAATLMQLALSRSREYLADETGAYTCRDPLALAAALEKLHQRIPHAHMHEQETHKASTASLFIVHPFTAQGLLDLFATHPPMHKRIERLRTLHGKMF